MQILNGGADYLLSFHRTWNVLWIRVRKQHIQLLCLPGWKRTLVVAVRDCGTWQLLGGLEHYSLATLI